MKYKENETINQNMQITENFTFANARKKAYREYKSGKAEARCIYREKRRALKDEYEICERKLRETFNIPLKKEPPKRTLAEELANSITHGLGALFALASLVLLLVLSDTSEEYAGAIIYSLGLFIMFIASTLYHAFRHGSAVKRLFRRFDYSSIYLLIGATFAPPLLSVVGGTFGLVFIIIQWAIIVTGITLVGVFGPTRLRFIHIPTYVVLGWSAMMLFPSLISVSLPLALWILAGGVIYTVGIIPFVLKMKGAHSVWHLFVLLGALVQWISIFKYIYLA